MLQKHETRRTALPGMHKRVSEVVRSKNTSEIAFSPLNLQVARITSRFAVSDAVARVLADHVFQKGTRR